jgi:hypothetical protein
MSVNIQCFEGGMVSSSGENTNTTNQVKALIQKSDDENTNLLSQVEH